MINIDPKELARIEENLRKMRISGSRKPEHHQETAEHKKMKSIVVSEFLKRGVKPENILIEKRTRYNNRYFKPDVTVNKDGRYIFIECHYHDNWTYTNVYGHMDEVRKLAEVIVCVTSDFDSRKPVEELIKNHKVLSKANEIWVIDLTDNCIKRTVKNV